MNATAQPATTNREPVKTPVPPLNLVGAFAAQREELLAEIEAIATSGGYVLGPKVAAFEQALAAYCGCKYALGVSSGTDGQLIALMAHDIGPGHEVIVPTFTFFATAGTVARVGATPVFCDIDPVTYNIDVKQIERLITPRTKAIAPVHLYGQLADIHEIQRIAKAHNLVVHEDAAQAIGARFGGPGAPTAGTFGEYGWLSFYPTKNLGALGDAGAVLTNDERLFELAKLLRIHGSGHTYFHTRVGGNFRIDALQAGILSIRLKMLEVWTEARRAVAARYNALFAAAELPAGAVQPPREIRGRHVYHQYVIRAQRRDQLADYLKARAIGCGVYYPLPLHLQECFKNLGHKPGDFPVAEQASKEVLALPVYPELTAEQQQMVVAAIAGFYRGE